MATLNELLKEYCPNGVKIDTLGNKELFKVFSGGTPSTTIKEYYEGSNPWVRSGELNFKEIKDSEIHISDKAIEKSSAKWIKANSVLIAMTGATVGRSAFNTVPITANQSVAAIEIVDTDIVNYKYVFYFIYNIYPTFVSRAQGALTSINLNYIKSVNIPLPPLPVQEKIVEILDTFTLLEAELEAELEMRKKQYEHYRDSLLNFDKFSVDCVEDTKEAIRDGSITLSDVEKYLWKLIEEYAPNGVEYKLLQSETEKLCVIQTGKLNANASNNKGKYPFFTCDAAPLKIDEYAFDTDAILISGNGSQVGHLHSYNGKFNAYQRTYVLDEFSKCITKKFLYFYFENMLRSYVIAHSKKGSVPYITLPMLQNIEVPIPPLEIQEAIVKVLDEFNALTTSIESGIPAEIDKVHKQYEYYRDKLLTFEESY